MTEKINRREQMLIPSYLPCSRVFLSRLTHHVICKGWLFCTPRIKETTKISPKPSENQRVATYHKYARSANHTGYILQKLHYCTTCVLPVSRWWTNGSYIYMLRRIKVDRFQNPRCPVPHLDQKGNCNSKQEVSCSPIVCSASSQNSNSKV